MISGPPRLLPSFGSGSTGSSWGNCAGVSRRPGPGDRQSSILPQGESVRLDATCKLGSCSRCRRAYRQLRRTDSDNPVGWRQPQKPAALQPLGIERHANAVMPKNFDQMTALHSFSVPIAICCDGVPLASASWPASSRFRPTAACRRQIFYIEVRPGLSRGSPA
jgi:hypothetical protein